MVDADDEEEDKKPSIWSNYGGGKDGNHDEDNDDGDEDNHDDHDDEDGEQPVFATKHWVQL